VHILVVSDTHVGPARRQRLPAALLEHAREADLILHGGDVTDADVLLELAAYAPLHAVAGNCDPLESRLPEQLVVELGGVRIGMLHDPGPEAGRRARLRARFPGCRVLIFGHTHLPVCADERGLLLLNPGSPTERRRAPEHSFAWLDLGADGAIAARIVPLPGSTAARG
jgi:putative phosphoesterase